MTVHDLNGSLRTLTIRVSQQSRGCSLTPQKKRSPRFDAKAGT